jgi:hypothetical protein
MAPIISTIVQWVILPSIISAIFGFAWIIANSTRTAELKVSAWAGLWAGQLAFVVYAVSQLGQIRDPDFHYSALPGLMPMSLTCGLVAGFVFLGLVRVAVPTRLVGLITLTLAGTSTSALFTYVFINSLRVSVLYWALGTALDILLHIVLYPASIGPIFRIAAKENPELADALHEAQPEFSAILQERRAS